MSGRVWIGASRDIQEGEEVTMNCNYEFNGFMDRICKCGAKHCVGFMIVGDYFGVKNPKDPLSTMIEMSHETLSRRATSSQEKQLLLGRNDPRLSQKNAGRLMD